MISMFFGPYMGNFDNLMVGDQVAARHSEAVLLVIAKGIDSMPVDIRIMYKQALAQFKPDDQVVVGYARCRDIGRTGQCRHGFGFVAGCRHGAEALNRKERCDANNWQSEGCDHPRK